MLQAVLFDLDDTLVIADNKALMNEYFQRLARRFTGKLDPAIVGQYVMASTMHTIKYPDGKRNNREIFEQHLFSALGLPVDMTPFMEFYATEYGELGKYAHPNEGARAAVEAAQRLGLRVALATNPVFPWIAVLQRLRWARLDDIEWQLVTNIDNMHYCKPHPEYFAAIAQEIGVSPTDCLMVGDDAYYDLAASLAGMRTFLLTPPDTQANAAEPQVLPPGAARQTALHPDYTGRLSDLPALLVELAQ